MAVDMESLAVFLEYLVSGADHCRTVVENHGNLLASLFVAGLIGGGGHCVAMCGPFVVAQSVSRLESLSVGQMREFHRIAGAALAPYHLGRSTTYIMLGAVAAEIAGGVMGTTGARWLSAVFLSLAAVLFLGYGIRKLAGHLPFSDAGGESWWSRQIGTFIKPLFARPVGLRGYGLGLALGFL
ncbi:MAG: sulfite exporter TauE/SafE family protein, partial [Rhodospirillales bacterium]|nr:sulfite exporter TauE/SafE family protein [Rhodospirillales bacterium]